jgi:putative ABC transport system permease protein
MDEQLGNMTAQRRLNMVLLAGLGVVALVLAAVGIYGVMSYSVSQRTHEIGVRVALGATSSQVFGLVLRQGLGLAVIGVVLGLAGSYVLTRFLPAGISESLLYQVSGTDRLIFALVPIVMSTVAVAACLIPARRATAVDPITALRYE